MAHKEQKDFCETIKMVFPENFEYCSVLDIGSCDVNGNNRDLFHNCEYTGIDICPGRNVDIVCSGHEYYGGPFDTIISTECFEHDKHWRETLQNACELLNPGGLFVFTCAAPGRPEHNNTNGYYRCLSEVDVRNTLPLDEIFSKYGFRTRVVFPQDLYFFGRKHGK